MGSVVLVNRPHKQTAVGLLLNGRDGQGGQHAHGMRRHPGKLHVGHHARQQLAPAVSHIDTYVVGMCQRVGLHTLFYPSAHKTAVDGLHPDYG